MPPQECGSVRDPASLGRLMQRQPISQTPFEYRPLRLVPQSQQDESRSARERFVRKMPNGNEIDTSLPTSRNAPPPRNRNAYILAIGPTLLPVDELVRVVRHSMTDFWTPSISLRFCAGVSLRIWFSISLNSRGLISFPQPIELSHSIDAC